MQFFFILKNLLTALCRKKNLPPPDIQRLIQYFNRQAPLSEEEENLISELFSPKTYRKRQYLLQEGDVAKYFNFVETGYLRLYKIDEKGVPHILQFATEDGWITDIQSFQKQIPSELSIDAIEDTAVFQISLEKLNTLYEKAPKFNLIFRRLSEKNQQLLQARILQMLSGDSRDCYLSFTETYPHLLNRLPQVQIASFIGITPEFLSKMRGKMARE